MCTCTESTIQCHTKEIVLRAGSYVFSSVKRVGLSWGRARRADHDNELVAVARNEMMYVQVARLPVVHHALYSYSPLASPIALHTPSETQRSGFYYEYRQWTRTQNRSHSAQASCGIWRSDISSAPDMLSGNTFRLNSSAHTKSTFSSGFGSSAECSWCRQRCGTKSKYSQARGA